MEKPKEESKMKITHVMADGSVRDSVDGYIKSADQLPPIAIKLIQDIINAGG